MARIICARGPVVEALKRYDPGLRVRWSHEKRRWAVDAPFKRVTRDWCPPPVRFEQVAPGQFVEHLLPEYSERGFRFQDKRYVVCWAKRVDWRLFFAVVENDAHRFHGGAAGKFDQSLAALEQAKERQAQRAKEERVYEGYDRLKHALRTMPWLEDGTGVSIKGMYQ